jgi:hypothetical protein
MGFSGRSASWKEGGDPPAVGRLSDSQKPKPGVTTADKEEDDTPQGMPEVVAEQSDIAEDFDVDEDAPDEPLAHNAVEDIRQSVSESDVQIEIDVDDEPAAEPVEDDGELTDQAVYGFASDDEDSDF